MGPVPIPAVFVAVDPDRLARLTRFLHNAARVELVIPNWAGIRGDSIPWKRGWSHGQGSGQEPVTEALSNCGTMSRAERNRTWLRVASAVRAHAQAGRWLGGRPPYGYRIGDLGPHPNPFKAASGARLHQLEVDPETARVVQRICAMFLAGAGYKHIATVLTNEGVPSPSAHDRARNAHRPGHAWAKTAVGSILANPRYLGYHVSGRTKKADFLLDPDIPALGHVTRQQWQHRSEWVTASVQTYDAIVDEPTWHRVQALIVASTRTKAVTPGRDRAHRGSRRSEPSRYPLAVASCSATAAARSSRATWSAAMPCTAAG